MRQPFVVVLLDGRKPFREGQQGRAGLLLLDVIPLRYPEVDQSGTPLPIDQDVAGLHVEMQDVLLVHKLQGLANLMDIAQGQPLGEVSLFLQQMFQRVAIDILHGDVGRVVLFEHLQHVHDVGMMHFRKDASLLQQLLFEFVEQLPARLGMDVNRQGLRVAIAIILEEILFDADGHLGLYRAQRPFDLCKPNASIGYTKPSLPNHLGKLVLPVLQEMSVWQMHKQSV